MSSLNVLLVTYVFPPGGGVGVFRAASLARYFPAEGIQLDVITARNASAVGADPSCSKRFQTKLEFIELLPSICRSASRSGSRG